MADIFELIQSAIKPLKHRILMSIARGIIEAVNDDQPGQTLKLSLYAGEERDRMERFQEYGFTSVPFEGAECVALFMGGNRDNGIVVATEDVRFRIKGLAEGEVALYTDEGDKIHFKRGGKIEITSSNIELGDAAATAIVKSPAFIALFNMHVHNIISPTPATPTTPPIVPATTAIATTKVKAT